MKCSAVKLKSDSIELNMSLFQSLLKYVALSKSNLVLILKSKKNIFFPLFKYGIFSVV